MQIYVSSTSIDLKAHRRAVIEALQRSGHTPLCMEHHAAASVVPRDECLREVAACDLYIGIFAWRYGFVPSGSELSITEMEYREAKRLNKTTLIFLLDENLNWPAEYRDVGEEGRRIRKFREKLQHDKWVRFFRNPDHLTTEVLAAIMRETYKAATAPTLAEKENQKTQLERFLEDQNEKKHQKRLKTRDRVPLPIPEKLILHFQDRDAELSQLRRCLADKNVKMALICGRGGAGKTTLAAKLIRDLIEESIVYVSLENSENRSPDRIIELLSRTLDNDAAKELKEVWRQGNTPLRDRLAVILQRRLSSHRYLLVLDNLESILDSDNRIPRKFAALRQFIEAFLEYDHEALLIITSRRAVKLSRDAEVAAISRSVQIPLDAGLPESFAIALLRDLDPDGRLGIKNATDETLGQIVRRCQGIPRTLETIVVTLRHHPTWTLDTLLGNETLLAQILDNPAREVYVGLSSDQERVVMQALALYDKPVPGAAIRFILPALPIDEILDRMVGNFVVNYDQARKTYWLHPLDRQYAYSQIPVHGNDYSKPALHRRAAQFYLNIPCPDRGSRTSMDDILPMIDAIEHLMAADQTEKAVALIFDNGIDEDLDGWGHYIFLIDLYRHLLNQAVSPDRKVAIHVRLGKIYRNLGELEKAKKTYESALPFIDGSANRECKIALFVALGDISYYLSDLDPAFKYHQQAEELLLANPIPRLQSENAGDLANVLLAKGEYEEAQSLYVRAISFSREAGNKLYEGIWNGGLANLYGILFDKTGDPIHRERAVSHYFHAIAIARETQDRRHESHWNGVLGNFYRKLGEYESAKAHLCKALTISEKICYQRMIPTQVQWLAAVFGERTQRYVQKQDFESALQVCKVFLKEADEVGSSELKEEAKNQISVLILNKIDFLFKENRVDEAFAESREFLLSPIAKAETCGVLGSICIQRGRSTGDKACFQLSIEAYTKGITLGSCALFGGLYEGRASACSLLGRIEEAIADYGEAVRREPQRTGAALSQAEVLIWAGRYDEALLSLESLHHRLRGVDEQAIGIWLICHALNLTSRDYYEFKIRLEDMQKDNVELKYEVTDIEPHLQQLDQTKFSETQIKNAWIIQDLILKLATHAPKP